MSPGRPRKWREGTRARLTVVLLNTDKERLQRYSHKTGLDMSVIMGMALREHLDAKGAK